MTKTDRNALSVSPVVNTQAYHDAYIQMPLPTAVCQAAYRQAGRILSATDGTEFEYLIALDARTGALIADNLDASPQRERTTGFRASDIEEIRRCPNGVVTIHNHPAGSQPSFQDIITAAEYPEISASVVVGHDGSVWYVSVKEPKVAEDLKTAYNLLKDYLADLAETAAVERLVKAQNGKLIDWRKMR